MQPPVSLEKRLIQKYIAAVEGSPKWMPGSLKRPWYMMNLENPVVDKLLAIYRRTNRIPKQFPLSDDERLNFELSLLNPEVRMEIVTVLNDLEIENAREARR